eukprot:2984221-Amphidinium_carterae.1
MQSDCEQCDQACNQSQHHVKSEKGQIVEYEPKSDPEQKKAPARQFNMVAEHVKFKGLSRAQINAIRLNVKDFLPQNFKGDRSQFKPWADEVMLFLSIEEPRLTNILRRLQTIRQPMQMSLVDTHWKQSRRDSSLSTLHRLLSMTKGESHASFILLCGYEAWPQLNIQYYGGSVARQYTNLRLILSPTGEITTVQARCSSNTLSGFRRFKSMIRLTRQGSVMTSRLQDNSEIIYYSTWMR